MRASYLEKYCLVFGVMCIGRGRDPVQSIDIAIGSYVGVHLTDITVILDHLGLEQNTKMYLFFSS